MNGNMPEAKQFHALEQIFTQLIQFCVSYFFQIMAAAVLFAAGWVVANRLAALITTVCAKKKMDLVLAQFLGGLVKVLTLTVFTVVALSALKIDVSPFIAAIGAGAFGLTLAIKGPLSNYGAGVAIILTRPFTVGHTITFGSHTGVVESVKLATTVLTTADGERVTIPNKHIVGEVIVNSFGNQLVTGIVGVAYGTDPVHGVQVIRQAVEKVEGVAAEPGVQAGIDSFGDSALNIGYRYWVASRLRHEVRYEVNLAVYKALKSDGIEIPFQRRDVHLFDVRGQ